MRSSLRVGAGFGVCAVFWLAAPSASAGPTFTRVLDAGPAVTDSTRDFGGSWADWNHDGNLDIYVVGEEIRAYVGTGSGSFEAVSGAFTSNAGGHWHAMGLFADWNDDGWTDLYLANFGTVQPNLTFVSPGPDRLFRNGGPPAFQLVLVPLDPTSTASVSPAWVDYDRDGDLDLSVSCAEGTTDLFYRNNGGSFSKITTLPFLNARQESAVSMWVDIDDDGDDDFYVVNHAATNELYRSMLTETGNADTFVPILSGPLVSDGTEFDITAEWCDYDDDGDLDAFIPVAGGGIDKLFRNEGGGTFTALSAPMTVAGSSTFGAWGDTDNDGDMDLLVGQIAAGPALPAYYRNEGGGAFVRVTSGLGSLLDPLRRPQAGAWADPDNDGDLDLYVVTFTLTQNPTSQPAPNVLHRNDTGGGNNWLQLTCVGTDSNRSAIGARVRVHATIDGQPRTQHRVVWGSMAGNSEQVDARLHFGLGNAAIVDSITVSWPSGFVQTHTDITPNRSIRIIEGVLVGVGPGGAHVPPGPRIRLAPNPFRGSVSIDWDGETRSIARVFDARGRVVRTLRFGTPLAASWDGTDDDGASVPPGVYYVRVSGSGGSRAAAVVRMR